MKKLLFVVPVLALSACSGNYPSWTLPVWWPGTHNVPPVYVNQDCVPNGPMEYSLDAERRSFECRKKAMTELFR